MIKIKKHYNLKIVSILITLVFCLNTLVYGIDIDAESHLRPRLIFDQDDNIKAEELYDRWHEKYSDQADIFLSIFGKMALEDPEAKKFIEKVLDISIDITGRRISKTRLLYLADIIKTNTWDYLFTMGSDMVTEFPDEFLYRFVKNRTSWWELISTYYIFKVHESIASLTGEKIDYSEIFKPPVKNRTKKSSKNKNIILPVLSTVPQFDILQPPNHIPSSLQASFYFDYTTYGGACNIYITTNDKNFIQELTKIASKKDYVAGSKGQSQPLFYLKVKKVRGKDNINRLLVIEFQPIVRLHENHPEGLKNFIKQAEKFAHWLLLNHSGKFIDNPKSAKKQCDRVSFLTTGHAITISSIAMSTALRWYTYSPQEAGFKITPCKSSFSLRKYDSRGVEIDVNFLWELPINISSNLSINRNILFTDSSRRNL